MAGYIARIERTYCPAKPMHMQCRGCGGGIDVWPPDEGEKRSVTCPACGWTATLGQQGPAEARDEQPVLGRRQPLSSTVRAARLTQMPTPYPVTGGPQG